MASGPHWLPVPAGCWATAWFTPGPEHHPINMHPSPFWLAGIRNADITAANYLGARSPGKIWEDIKSGLA